MSKEKPLTKEDIRHVSTYGWEGSVQKTKKKYPYEMFSKEDVLSALALTKKKINEVFNPDEMYWLKINEILDECFQIQEQDQEEKCKRVQEGKWI